MSMINQRPRVGGFAAVCLAIFASVSSIPVTAHAAAAVATALSCEAVDVQAALDNAADGTTLLIPAGSCDWHAQSVSRSAGVRIIGAGRDATHIKRSNAPTGDPAYALVIDCSNGLTTELAGITFEGKGVSSAEDNGVSLYGGCLDFRVHDMRFIHFGDGALEVRGVSRGVIYDSEFNENFNPGLGYGVVVYGADTWPALDLGSANAVFIEDNSFHGNRHDIASNYGANYVARHNLIVTTTTTREWAMIDAHGRQDHNRRGTRSWEIYQNQLDVEGTTYTDGIGIRGGDGVIWGNTISGDIAYTAQFVIEDGCPTNDPVQGDAGPYPVPDQTMLAWIWGNIWGDNTQQFIRTAAQDSFNCNYYFQEGRNYFQYAKPGYTPYPYPHPLRDFVFRNGFEVG